MRDRLDPCEALDADAGHDPAHPRPRPRVVVDVDELCLAGIADRARRFDQAVGVRAERRIQLHRDDELAVREEPLELGRRLGRRDRGRPVPLAYKERSRRCGVLVDGAADRGAASPAETPASVWPSPSKVISATTGSCDTERTASTAVTRSSRS